MSEPTSPELDIVEAKRILRVNNGGEPVGYRRLRKPTTLTPCDQGCLAPGSSPHFHAIVTGYVLMGTTGWVEVDAALVPVAVGTVHPFAETGDSVAAREQRTAWRVTVADLDALAERELSDEELQRIANAIDHSTAMESIAAALDQVAEPKDTIHRVF